MTNEEKSETVYSENGKVLIRCADKGITALDVKPGTETIAYEAFADCEMLAQITIPDSVVYIGNYAFRSCKSLKHIVLPSSLQYIGECTFENCAALRRIVIPKSVKVFELMRGNSSLQVKVPDDVPNIFDDLFRGSSPLREVVIPSSVESVSKDAFDRFKNAGIIYKSHRYKQVDDFLIYVGDDGEILKHYDGDSPSIDNIPETVTNIENGLFKNNLQFA